MDVSYIQHYPIVYDWIIAILSSIAFIVFYWVYGFKYKGWATFIIAQMITLAIFYGWNGIFLYTGAKHSPLSPFQQMLMLAPIVTATSFTFVNLKLNIVTEEKE